MNSDESIQSWIALAKVGDTNAQAELWEQFFPQLMRLAKARLQGALRMGDEEDVVLSVFQSFFRAAVENRFPDVRGRDDLWRLLSRMTHRKAIDWLRHAQRQKRHAVGESAIANVDGAAHPMANLPGDERSPLLEMVAIDELRRLMMLLSPEMQQIAMWKLDGYSNVEIANLKCCSIATVERRLKLIRDIWSSSEKNE